MTRELEIIFDTMKTSRKYANSKKNPRVAWVNGCTTEVTVHYEGSAGELEGEELAKYEQTYCAKFPDGRERLTWPGITYFVVRPKWVRYGDYNPEPMNRGESILAEASYALCSVFRKSKLGSILRRRFCGEISLMPICIQLIPSPELCAQSSRRATATGRTAARIAGSSPPSTPITSANNTPIRRRSKVILNAKARLEKVCQFMVLVVKPLSGRTARQPIKPAANDINRASKRKERMTFQVEKPRARMVAISRPRSATAEYMVFKAPNIAPIAIMAATKPPRTVMSRVIVVDCLA